MRGGGGGDLGHLGQGADRRQEPGHHHHHAGPLVLGAVGDRPQDRRQSGQVDSSASVVGGGIFHMFWKC